MGEWAMSDSVGSAGAEGGISGRDFAALHVKPDPGETERWQALAPSHVKLAETRAAAFGAAAAAPRQLGSPRSSVGVARTRPEKGFAADRRGPALAPEATSAEAGLPRQAATAEAGLPRRAATAEAGPRQASTAEALRDVARETRRRRRPDVGAHRPMPSFERQPDLGTAQEPARSGLPPPTKRNLEPPTLRLRTTGGVARETAISRRRLVQSFTSRTSGRSRASQSPDKQPPIGRFYAERGSMTCRNPSRACGKVDQECRYAIAPSAWTRQFTASGVEKRPQMLESESVTDRNGD
jgi:hypothetical protein